MARTTEVMLAGLLALAALLADADERHISLNGYDDDAQLLFVNLVAPAAGNPTLYLNADGMLSELDRFELIGEHSLVVHLPCDDFTGDDTLVYKRGNVTLPLALDGITCSRNQGRLRQPRLVYSHAQCVVDPRGTTLWRVGSLLAEKNGYSVYQNMYAVFLSNRHHFVAEDITRMQDRLLLCPPEEMIASIDKRHAVEMFQDAEAFRLASNMQKGAPVGSEEANDPDEGGEQLAQLIAPAEAASAELASVKEVAEQAAEAASAELASVKEVAERAADAGLLAMAAADDGATADANAVVDEKSEGGELLAQVTSPADAVSTDAVVEMAADSEHLVMASAAMGAGDKDRAASAEADVKSEGGELLAQVTAPSEGVAEQEVDAELLAMSQYEGDGEQPLGQFTAPAEVAKQEHPIVDTTLAVISDGDKDVVPKLVIAIDGGKQAGHLNVVPGCYIEPNNKTLWRVGLALNKLNGHTVYQNMYAVFSVNPEAFPSENLNHMLNQKLRCPSAREVTKHTTKESKALMGLDLPG